jgi:RimJ/RimL family protein N-acetyltransferase
MRHDIRVVGHAFALRPVDLTDAPLIVALRADTERARHLHPVELDIAAQEEYLSDYFQREGDYYFVIVRRAARDDAEGLIGIYDVDDERRRAEWGRWITHRTSLAAVESAWLIYRVAFERLGLREVYCHTLEGNTAALSFHDRCGLTRRDRLQGKVEIGGERHAVIEHVLDREAWATVSELLETRARRLASRVGATS